MAGMPEFRAFCRLVGERGASVVMSPSGEKPRYNRRLGDADGVRPREGHPSSFLGLFETNSTFCSSARHNYYSSLKVSEE